MAIPRQNTFSETIAAPIGGWNTQSSLDFMPAEDAVTLVNWWPETNRVRIRKGSANHSGPMGSGLVESMKELSTSGGTRKLIAAANNNLYDITTGTPASLAAGLTNNRWQIHQFRNRLFMVNGADAPRDWDGSTLSTTAWGSPAWITSTAYTANDIVWNAGKAYQATNSGTSGATPPTHTSGTASDGAVTWQYLVSLTDFVHVGDYKSRIYFVEGTSVWYGDVNLIAGPLTEFDIGSLLTEGGELLFFTQWSQETGEPDTNQAVFVGSEGDVLIYQGDNPEATNWGLARRFVIPRPLGRRAFCRIGADIAIMTEGGLILLSEWMRGEPDETSQLAYKVQNTLIDYAQAYGSNAGWEVFYSKRLRMVLVNIPVNPGVAYCQVAFNTLRSPWSPTLLKGINAGCWATFDQEPHFGGIDGYALQFWTGNLDRDQAIEHELKTAFYFFQNNRVSRGDVKVFKLIRPSFIVDADITLDYGLDTNLEDLDTNEQITIETGGSFYGVPWTTPWPKPTVNVQDWISVSGIGNSAAVKLRGQANEVNAFITSAQVVFEKGGIL